MTINEIESTVQSLCKRHDNLTEAMLLLLLEAGGWEKKHIKEAVAIYRNVYRKQHEDEEIAKHSLPPLTESPVFEQPVPESHLLLDHLVHKVERAKEPEADLLTRVEGGYHMEQPEEQVITTNTSSKEPQSLIEEGLTHAYVNSELPHNLPVKPFETTPHIWSFARYKSIFFGEDAPTEKSDLSKNVQTVSQSSPQEGALATPRGTISTTGNVSHQVVISAHNPIPVAPQKIQVLKKQSSEDIHTIYIEKTPLSKDDEKLALLTSFMLLAILLLLGYMYSNGRL